MAAANFLEDSVTPQAYSRLTTLLVDLDECDLGDWDRNFIDDMKDRVEKYGRDTMISARQQEQLTRMEEKHL